MRFASQDEAPDPSHPLPMHHRVGGGLRSVAMATREEAGEEGRRAALAVLTTGIVGDALLERVAQALIVRATGQSVPNLEIAPDEISRLDEFGRRHCVSRQLGHIVPELATSSVADVTGALAMEHRLIRTVEGLAAAGVPALALKGNATAHLDHPNPTDRHVSDIDLLVHPGDLDRAIMTLERISAHRTVSHPFSDPMLFHSETLVHGDGTEIDLHHRLAQPSRTPTSCWHQPDTFVLGGVQIQAMPRTWRFLHALLHQLKDSPPTTRSLNGVIDMVLLWSKGIDAVAVRAAANEVGMSELTERGLARLTDLLEAPRLVRPPVALRQGWAERRLAACLDSAGAVPGHVSLAANLAVLPAAWWPRHLSQVVWPVTGYRRMLGITFRSQVRHVAREVTGR